MATQDEMLYLMDNRSAQLEKVMDRANLAMTQNVMNVYMTQVNNNTAVYEKTVNNMQVSMEKASGSSEKLSKKLEKNKERAKKAAESLKSLTGSIFNMGNLNKGMQMTDAYIQSTEKLKRVNDGTQSTGEVQDKVFAAANGTRGSFGEMTDAVSLMDNQAGGRFEGTDETIRFTELLQKTLKLSGDDPSKQQDTFSQVAQAMSGGQLEGDAFQAVMDSAPMAADAIASYMGKSREELQKLSEQGLITADVVKNAMFQAGDSIDEQFMQMPLTFADVGGMLSNNMMQSFGPVMEQINGMLNSDAVQELMMCLQSGMAAIADGLSWVVGMIMSGDPLIKAFFGAAIVMAGLWAAQMLIAAAATMVANMPLLLTIGLIAMAILVLTKMGATFADIFGFIGTIVGGVYAVGYNIVASIWNIILSLAEFMANVFQNPLGAIVNLFVNMSTSVLGLVASIAKSIDDVFGTHLADKVNGASDKLQQWGDKFKKDNYISFDDMRMESKDVEETSKQWGEAGSNMGSFLDDWDFGSNLAGMDSGLADAGSMGAGTMALEPMGSDSNPATVQGTGNGGAVQVDMEKEDIQYLRDLAQRDYIAKIATNTLAPNIHVEFTGAISQEADVDMVADRVGMILYDQISVCAEGGY